jgi:hypothetical protein
MTIRKPTRAQLAKILPDQQVVLALEQLFDAVNGATADISTAQSDITGIDAQLIDYDTYMLPGVDAGVLVVASAGNTVPVVAASLVVDDGTRCRLLRNVSVTPDCSTAGPAANGRDQAGAFANNTWIYVHVIWGTGKTVAGLLSTSKTAPVLPNGYTHWVVVSAFNTGSGVNVAYAYKHTGVIGSGAVAVYSIPPALLSGGVATSYTNLTALANLVPPVCRVPMLVCSFTPAAAGRVLHLSANGTNDCASLVGQVASVAISGSFAMPCGGSQNIYYYVTNAADSANISVAGWIL